MIFKIPHCSNRLTALAMDSRQRPVTVANAL
jgi:hypothetical protein